MRPPPRPTSSMKPTHPNGQVKTPVSLTFHRRMIGSKTFGVDMHRVDFVIISTSIVSSLFSLSGEHYHFAPTVKFFDASTNEINGLFVL